MGAHSGISYPLLQLMRFRDAEEFVSRMQSREIITFASVEKSFLPDVNVKKTQERTERHAVREQFQFPPETNRHVR